MKGLIIPALLVGVSLFQLVSGVVGGRRREDDAWVWFLGLFVGGFWFFLRALQVAQQRQ